MPNGIRRSPASSQPIPSTPARPSSTPATPAPAPQTSSSVSPASPGSSASPASRTTASTSSSFAAASPASTALGGAAIPAAISAPVDRLSRSYVEAMRGVTEAKIDPTQSVKLDPFGLVGAMSNGDLRMEIPITDDMVKDQGLKAKPGAKAIVRFAVKDGQIDFQKTRVDLEGIKGGPLKLVSVKNLHLDDKGRIKAHALGLNLDITKKLFGASQIPRSMEAMSQVLQQKFGQAQDGASGGMTLPTSVKINAEGMALRPDRAISLGDGNFIDFHPASKLNLQGDLQNMTLSGRVQIDGMKLQGSSSKIELGAGHVAFRAEASRTPQGAIRADLQLDKIDVTAKTLQQGLGGRDAVSLSGAALQNGRIHAKLDVSSQGQPTLRSIDASGSVRASSVAMTSEGAQVQAKDIQASFHFQDNASTKEIERATIQDLSGRIENMSLRTPQGDTARLSNASVEGADFGIMRDASGKVVTTAEIPRFQGTLSGQILPGQGQGSGSKIALQEATASGSLRLDPRGVVANVDLTTLRSEAHEVRLERGGDSVDIQSAGVQGRGTIGLKDGQVTASSVSGKTHVVLNDAKVNLPSIGSFDIGKGTRADLEVTSATIGSNLKDGQIAARGTLTGTLDHGKLAISDKLSVDLKQTEFDLNLREIDKKPGQALPTFKGDLTLKTQLEAPLKESLKTRLGSASIRDVGGKVAVDIKDIQMDAQGRIKAKKADVKIEATVKSIQGKITVDPQSLLRLPEAAASATPATSANPSTSAASGVLALQPSTPVLQAPLSVDPLAMAKRIHNGTLEVELPLKEAGLEDATKVLGMRTLDVHPDTKILAKLEVKDGKIQYDKSSLRLSRPIEALGIVDLQLPRINPEGKIVIGVMGKDINLTSWVTGKDRLPGTVEQFVDQAASKAPASGASTSLGTHLEQAGRYADLGDIKLSAKGVSLAPGRMMIGDNDYIEIDPQSRVDISGTSREMKVSGDVSAKNTYVDLGGSTLDLSEGRLRFDATVTTGISERGRLEKDSQVHVRLSIPQATVREVSHSRSNGDQIHLKQGTIRDATVEMGHRFRVSPQGTVSSTSKPDLSLRIGAFEGQIARTKLTLQDAPDSTAALSIADAKGSGSLTVGKDGIQADLAIQNVDASLSGLDIDAAGQRLVDLQGSLQGNGRLRLDSQKGLSLEGDLQMETRVKDGQIRLGNNLDLDLSDKSSASIALRKLALSGGAVKIDGDLSILAGLDKGSIQLSPQDKPIHFRAGSQLQLSTTLSSDSDKPLLTMKGRLQAELADRTALRAALPEGGRLTSDVTAGRADIDLGSITLQNDGRYRIADPKVSLSLALQNLSLQR